MNRDIEDTLERIISDCGGNATSHGARELIKRYKVTYDSRCAAK